MSGTGSGSDGAPGDCSELEGTFLEDLLGGLETLPDDILAGLADAMKKTEPFRVGSWTQLRDGLNAVVMDSMKEILENLLLQQLMFVFQNLLSNFYHCLKTHH